MSKDPEFSVLMCGVGGQGLVLLSTIVGNASVRDGLRVITGEQHGLSQRSGSVSIHLRIGPQVRSPLIPVGSGDAILALEAIEALRSIEYLKAGGVVVMNTRIMHPVTETGERIREKYKPYLERQDIESRIRQVSERIFSLDALALAGQTGNPLTENVVLLGAMSVLEDFPLSLDSIRAAIGELVPPRASEANRKAFDLGAKAAHDRFCLEMACKQV